MIIFDLSCEQKHVFEGWFSSQSSYESQLHDGLIACPQCGSIDIHRVPSAVHLGKSEHVHSSGDALPVSNAQSGLLVAYQQLISAIVTNSDDVGKAFAEEARKIHYHEVPLRLIRGETSVEEYESLREEGIDVLHLPILKKENLN